MFALGVILGLAIGGVIAWFWRGAQAAAAGAKDGAESRARAEAAERLAVELKAERERLTAELQAHVGKLAAAEATAKQLQASHAERVREFDELKVRMADTFKALSTEVLQASNAELLKQSREVLAAQVQSGDKDLTQKKELIEKSLQGVGDRLVAVEKLVRDFESDRAAKFGKLEQGIQQTHDEAQKMQKAAQDITAVLKDTRKRGDWGERMAEDVLRLMGFIEGVNYFRQKSLETSRNRPDYTFPLPNDLKVHMDVKFPLNNYLSYVNAATDADREQFRKQFLADARQRINEVTGRDYIDASANTLDYVLLFIPNEQIYAFLNHESHELVDLAVQKRVILCSPLTLYAVMSLIRQSVENFRITQASNEMLALLGGFRKQWLEFLGALDDTRKNLHKTAESFDALMTTRRRKLEVQVRELESLREQKHIEPRLLDAAGDETAAAG